MKLNNLIQNMSRYSVRKNIMVNLKKDHIEKNPNQNHIKTDKELTEKLKEKYAVKLELSKASKEISETISGATSNGDFFSNTTNLGKDFAKDYEARLKKIKDIVSKNPELKGKEKDFIKELDMSYETDIEMQADFIAREYVATGEFMNKVGEFIAEKFGESFTPSQDASVQDAKQIKQEYVNFFKNITDKIKQGVAPDDIGKENLNNNKYIKNFSDVKGIDISYDLAASLFEDVQEEQMASTFFGYTEEQTFSNVRDVLNRYKEKFDETNAQSNTNIKQYTTKFLLNIENLMTKVENKLAEKNSMEISDKK